MKTDIVKGTPLRVLYYRGTLCIMTPDNDNPNPILTVGCGNSTANLIEAVYNVQDE